MIYGDLLSCEEDDIPNLTIAERFRYLLAFEKRKPVLKRFSVIGLFSSQKSNMQILRLQRHILCYVPSGWTRGMPVGRHIAFIQQNEKK